MRIYTSYFANIKNLKHNMVPVSISAFGPKWLEGQVKTCLLLAPPEQLVLDCKQGRHPGEEVYYKTYWEQTLNKRIPEEIEDYLLSISDGGDVVLMCYEPPGELCHRHYAGDWLELTLGYNVQELEVK